MQYKLEICVDSLESAVQAQQGGAHRIELCSALQLGGLTPTAGLLKVVRASVSTNIPIYCMLRPRAGDFVYTDAECETILADLHVLKSIGCNGFVFGALDEGGSVDERLCRTVVEEAKPLPVTFHRAFDVSPQDWETSIERIKTFGFERILTSGQTAKAPDGIGLLRTIVKKAASDIKIMIGSGVTEANISHLVAETGATEFHSSASVFLPSKFKAESKIAMGAADQSLMKVTDREIVQRMVKILDSYGS